MAQTSGWAITGFVLSIVNFLFLGWIPLLGWIAVVATLTIGISAIVHCTRNSVAGKGLGITATVLSGVQIIIKIIILIIVVWLIGSTSISDTNTSSTNPYVQKYNFPDSYYENHSVSDSNYTNPEYNYTILIPKDFVFSEKYFLNGGLILWNGPSDGVLPLHAFPFVSVQVLPAKNYTLDSFISNERNWILNETNSTNITLSNGRTAILTEYYRDGPRDDVYKSIYMYVHKKEFIFVVGVRAELQDWELNKDVWMRIISSFEV